MVVYQGVEESMEQLCFVHQKSLQYPRKFQQGMNLSYPFNSKYNAHYQPWFPPSHSRWLMPTPCLYPPQKGVPPFHPYANQPSQWANPSQGWRPHAAQPLTLMPLPRKKNCPKTFLQRNTKCMPNQIQILIIRHNQYIVEKNPTKLML